MQVTLPQVELYFLELLLHLFIMVTPFKGTAKTGPHCDGPVYRAAQMTTVCTADNSGKQEVMEWNSHTGALLSVIHHLRAVNKAVATGMRKL